MDDFAIVATTRTLEKLEADHGVSVLEVEEAFFNFEGAALIDDREQHKTNPPTVWFIAPTESGRLLKVVGIPLKDTKEFLVKSAFDPDDWEIELYEKNQ